MELPHVSTSNAHAGIFSLALLFFFFYAFLTVSRRFAAPPKRLPPQAASAWPLIGRLHLLSGPDPTHITLGKMADAYGPIFTLKLGMHRAIIVSSWEIARECFTTHDRIFASRPKLVASELLGYKSAMFGLSPYGPHWRHARKIATLEFLTNHRLEQLQHIRTSEVKSSINKLYRLWVEGRNNGDDKMLVEMKTWFGDVTLNTILRIVVGRRFSAAFDGGCNDECRRELRNFFEIFGIFIPSDSFSFLSRLDLGGHLKRMKKTGKAIDEMLDKWLKEHQQKRNSGEVKKMEEQDFMDVMLSAVEDDGGEFFGCDPDTAIKATCLNMILGGFDTTTVTMTWALSLLLNNKIALTKVQFELDEQVGREREVRESDVKNLLYLQAIVKETLRLYPAAPLLVPRESNEDCTVAGYHIAPGTRLIVNIKKFQRDPLVWEDPCEFRPERFLTNHKDIDVRGQNPQLIPFGSGRRVCPEISFAFQVMHLALANLLHGFEISRPTKELLNMEEDIGLTSVKKTSLEVALTPRLSTQVYDDLAIKF